VRHGVSEVNAISSIISVKKIPKTIFNHLLKEGSNRMERKTITAGMASSTEAAKSLAGLSNKLAPEIRPSTFLGRYNSK